MYSFLNETLPVPLITSHCGHKKAKHYSINFLPVIRYNCYNKYGTEARLSWGSFPSNFKPPVWAPSACTCDITCGHVMSIRFNDANAVACMEKHSNTKQPSISNTDLSAIKKQSEKSIHPINSPSTWQTKHSTSLVKSSQRLRPRKQSTMMARLPRTLMSLL